MEYLILPISFLICMWFFELYHYITTLIKTIEEKHEYLFRVEDDYLGFLSYSLYDGYFNNYRIRFLGELDTIGCAYQVDFSYRLFKKDIEIPVAKYYFYYEESYKNRKEWIWPKQKNDQELNCLETLVRKLMTVLLMRQLKKKSLV